MHFVATTALAAACLTAGVAAQAQLAPLEPSRGIMLGAWMDTAPGMDTPKDFNTRFGHNISMIHLAQNLPIEQDKLAPVQLIDQTGTNAILYLSVYPTVTPDNLSDKAINDFVQQLATFTHNGRGILLRIAPEMNGNWQPYGQKPVAFVAMWRKLVTAIRAVDTNKNGVSFIWAPNIQGGYPYGRVAGAATDPEFAAMDTNKDGTITVEDDGYTPFYPGDEYVDWVGLSTYWFGPGFPYVINDIPPPGFMERVIHGVSAGGNGLDFYQAFSQSRNKPFFITESGSAFHLNRITSVANPTNTGSIAPGPGELAIKQAFWRQYLTNTTFLDKHPLLKAVSLFEWLKPEETTMREFHISKDPAILAALKADLEKPEVLARYFFANAAQIVTDPTAPVVPIASNGSVASGGAGNAPPAGNAGSGGSNSAAGVVERSALVGLVAAIAAVVLAF
ncbi:glycoside hydrolase superfamily [Fimicolochytrium jonesii]|uniref:glycoside hydrolase superfamily n=1 Tax=Fimicolochytrium jonesii TaxID=1396493 RepID=UPI0022FDBDFE|nr:glycoside hydrolase superfamily [Fimicolochytrium jonesii]KAI8817285.1 glycoside hydrolase superfamily [Fimicolochytrium jonesii]